jgi:hypothetical protein
VGELADVLQLPHWYRGEELRAVGVEVGTSSWGWG